MFAKRGEREPHDPSVRRVTAANDQPCFGSAVDELRCAVLAEEQRLRDIADGWWTRARVTTDRQQQLVLRWREARAVCLFLTPVLEPAEPDPQLQEPLVIGIGRLASMHG